MRVHQCVLAAWSDWALQQAPKQPNAQTAGRLSAVWHAYIAVSCSTAEALRQSEVSEHQALVAPELLTILGNLPGQLHTFTLPSSAPLHRSGGPLLRGQQLLTKLSCSAIFLTCSPVRASQARTDLSGEADRMRSPSVVQCTSRTAFLWPAVGRVTWASRLMSVGGLEWARPGQSNRWFARRRAANNPCPGIAAAETVCNVLVYGLKKLQRGSCLQHHVGVQLQLPTALQLLEQGPLPFASPEHPNQGTVPFKSM